MTVPQALAMVNNSVVQNADGSLDPMFKASGDDVAFGLNAGYLYEFDEGTRWPGLAIAYSP